MDHQKRAPSKPFKKGNPSSTIDSAIACTMITISVCWAPGCDNVHRYRGGYGKDLDHGGSAAAAVALPADRSPIAVECTLLRQQPATVRYY